MSGPLAWASAVRTAGVGEIRNWELGIGNRELGQAFAIVRANSQFLILDSQSPWLPELLP